MLIRFMLVFRPSIRVSFLLEVCQRSVRVSLKFICGSFIFQHNSDRERESCYWVKGTNQRHVQRRMRGAQTPVGNDVVKTRVTSWKRKKTCSPLSRGCLFSLRMCHPFLSSGTSGNFCEFKFSPFFSKIQLKFLFLSIRSLQNNCLLTHPKEVIPCVCWDTKGFISHEVLNCNELILWYIFSAKELNSPVLEKRASLIKWKSIHLLNWSVII